MSNANKNNETKRNSTSLKDLAIGGQVQGYVKGFFKNPKGLTPDVENIVLTDKDGVETILWAAGTLNYFRERMEKAGVTEGVMARVTRIEKPANTKKGSRQKYFATIEFAKGNTVDLSAPQFKSSYSGGGGSSAPDSDGFSEY